MFFMIFNFETLNLLNLLFCSFIILYGIRLIIVPDFIDIKYKGELVNNIRLYFPEDTKKIEDNIESFKVYYEGMKQYRQFVLIDILNLFTITILNLMSEFSILLFLLTIYISSYLLIVQVFGLGMVIFKTPKKIRKYQLGLRITSIIMIVFYIYKLIILN